MAIFLSVMKNATLNGTTDEGLIRGKKTAILDRPVGIFYVVPRKGKEQEVDIFVFIRLRDTCQNSWHCTIDLVHKT